MFAERGSVKDDRAPQHATPLAGAGRAGGSDTAGTGKAPLPSCRDYARYARMSFDRIARDCEVSAFRATGPGGQGVNTADSAVRMRHLPTGAVVVSRESRSQHQNRLRCLAKLRELFECRAQPPKVRKKTRVSRAQKERRLKVKHRAGEKKALRKPVRPGDE